MIHYTPPGDWHLGPFTVNVHSGAFCLGALAAFFWTLHRLPEQYKKHLDPMVCWMTLAGIAGARLFFVFSYFHTIKSFWEIFFFWQGGLVSYGGLIGALGAMVIYLKVHKLPIDVFCEALGPAGLLGWGIGRFGCFFNWYHEYGTETDMPWGFIVGNDPPRHPIMLFIAIIHCLVALNLSRIARKTHINSAGLALTSFGATRLIFDFWRYYNPEWLCTGSKILACLLIISGIWVSRKVRYCDLSQYDKVACTDSGDTINPDAAGNDTGNALPKSKEAATQSNPCEQSKDPDDAKANKE
ncbi:MAG: prolipoprotein diacylglyceryl transferase [bacterium]|nr:prolipoprotein diacylglyceryl transferase [bacterium]